VKLRDLERHLLAHGARKVGEGGKHTKWRSADGVRATAVPRHTEIGPDSSALSAGNSRSQPRSRSSLYPARVTLAEIAERNAILLVTVGSGVPRRLQKVMRVTGEAVEVRFGFSI
jgi:hypothetical protein